MSRQDEELRKYMDIHCLTPDEKWEVRRQEWIKQYELKGFRPSQTGNTTEEKRAAQWQNDVRQQKLKRILKTSRIHTLESTNGWTWDSFTDNFNNWLYQFKENNGIPRNNKNNSLEARAYRWMHSVFSAKRGSNGLNLTPCQINVLNNTPQWSWESKQRNDISFEEQLQNWINCCTIYKRKPSMTSRDKNEKVAAKWQYNINARKETLPKEHLQLLNNTSGWKWHPIRRQDRFDGQHKNWVEQYQSLGRLPYMKSSVENEVRAAQWQNVVRHAKKKGKLTLEQIDVLNNTKGWIWSVRETNTSTDSVVCDTSYNSSTRSFSDNNGLFDNLTEMQINEDNKGDEGEMVDMRVPDNILQTNEIHPNIMITLASNNLVQEAICFHKQNNLTNNDLVETIQAMLEYNMYTLGQELTQNKMDFSEANTLFLAGVAPAKIKKNELQNLIFKNVVCDSLI
jgi:hypothetical protein